MDDRLFAAALSAINPRRCAGELTVLLALRVASPREPEVWLAISRREISELTGFSSAAAGQALHRLAAHGVIELVSGRGSRSSWVRIVDDIVGWALPWRLDPARVLVCFTRNIERATNTPMVARSYGKPTAISGRSYMHEQHFSRGRSSMDEQRGASLLLVHGRAARANSSPAGGLPQKRATNPHVRDRAPLVEELRSSSSSSRTRARASSEEEEEQSQPLRELIEARAGTPLWGAPLEELRRYIAGNPDLIAAEARVRQSRARAAPALVTVAITEPAPAPASAIDRCELCDAQGWRLDGLPERRYIRCEHTGLA